MLIYFSVILFCFFLSFFKLPKFVENGALILVAIFLCFGYMTGSDWYNYELYYKDSSLSEAISLRRETGYFFIQSLISNIGVDFWTFHIITKLLVFYTLVYFIRHFKVNIFLFLALFIPEAGLYLFIDCPFRNLIAFGISLLAMIKLFEGKKIAFFLLILIAANFHITALILIPAFFIYDKNYKVLVILILTILIYSIAFNADFMIKKVYLPLTEISSTANERLKGYLISSDFISNSINIGAFIRVAVMILMLLYRETIIGQDKTKLYVYNLGLILLLIYPLGISMKALQRFSLYFTPFYILSILFLLNSLKIKMNVYVVGLFFFLLSLLQTYNVITKDFRYVPYTNYLKYWVKKDFPSMKYRREYNRENSPYRNKK